MLSFMGKNISDMKASPSLNLCAHILNQIASRGTKFLREEAAFKREQAASQESKGMKEDAINTLKGIKYESPDKEQFLERV